MARNDSPFSIEIALGGVSIGAGDTHRKNHATTTARTNAPMIDIAMRAKLVPILRPEANHRRTSRGFQPRSHMPLGSAHSSAKIYEGGRPGFSSHGKKKQSHCEHREHHRK